MGQVNDTLAHFAQSQNVIQTTFALAQKGNVETFINDWKQLTQIYFNSFLLTTQSPKEYFESFLGYEKYAWKKDTNAPDLAKLDNNLSLSYGFIFLARVLNAINLNDVKFADDPNTSGKAIITFVAPFYQMTQNVILAFYSTTENVENDAFVEHSFVMFANVHNYNYIGTTRSDEHNNQSVFIVQKVEISRGFKVWVIYLQSALVGLAFILGGWTITKKK